jgi:Flp pilus assembly protein TadG
MIAAFRRFLKNRRGIAAMEFALVSPMILFVTLGAFDLVELMHANKRVENVAASIADVVSRDIAITDAELNDIMGSTRPLMSPLSDAGMGVRLTSATVTAANRAEVVWSEAKGGLSRFNQGASIDVPEPVGETGTGVIIVTVHYSWSPPLGMITGGARTIEHSEYRRPRIADPVLRLP